MHLPCRGRHAGGLHSERLEPFFRLPIGAIEHALPLNEVIEEPGGTRGRNLNQIHFLEGSLGSPRILSSWSRIQKNTPGRAAGDLANSQTANPTARRYTIRASRATNPRKGTI
jgi:hypothetical protein